MYGGMKYSRMHLIHLLMILHLTKMSVGDGMISILLTKYNNKEGKENKGYCCESYGTSNCRNPCDHYFIICLDRLGGSQKGVDQCPFGKKTTGAIGQNVITFGNSISGTPNPMRFPFEKWLGGFLFKVKVWDRDSNGDDLVDFLSVDARLNASRNGSEKEHFEAKDRTQLDFEVTVVCNPNWCGPLCDEDCDYDNRTSPGICEPANAINTTFPCPSESLPASASIAHFGSKVAAVVSVLIIVCAAITIVIWWIESLPASASIAHFGSKVAAVVSVLIIVCAAITIVIWWIHRKKPKQLKEPPTHKFTLDGEIYYEAQPYVSRTGPIGNTNNTDAGTDNDAYIYDNAVYEGGSRYKPDAKNSMDVSKTGAHAMVKMDTDIKTVQYCNGVLVTDTGDIYAEANK